MMMNCRGQKKMWYMRRHRELLGAEGTNSILKNEKDIGKNLLSLSGRYGIM